MKCLVINLDRSADRLTNATAEFTRIGVAFERVSGLDAAAGSPVVAPPLTAAEVCCFLSHRLCWQIIADGADRFGAIFEDDVVFSHDAGLLLSDDGWVPSDADVVKLETYFVRVRIGRQHLAVGNGYSVARLVGRHLGAAGYIVSREAAQKLLQRTKRLKGVVDYVLFSPTMMTCSRNTIYQLTPALCAQAQYVWENGSPATLIQINPPNRPTPVVGKVLGEAARTFAHLRNRSFLGSQMVDAVALRQP